MIRCVDVHKSYRTGDRAVPALRGATWEVDSPGFYAVMGQSGSGKSTMLHLLGALDVPDRGEIHVAEVALHAMKERDAVEFRRTRVGLVFQQFNLIPTLTALENVELPGMLAGRPARALRERGLELLGRLGLSERVSHRPDALSGGEQQRVAIARALMHSPSIVLADEPTGNLDATTSEGLWRLLGEVAREHATTVVMVTHEPAAAAHCRRVYVLRDGVMTATIETEGLDAAGVAARYQQLVRTA